MEPLEHIVQLQRQVDQIFRTRLTQCSLQIIEEGGTVADVQARLLK